MDGHGLYQVLGVVPSASSKLIKKSFLRKGQRCHPEQFSEGWAEELAYLVDAHKILSDPVLRDEYDKGFLQAMPPHLRTDAESSELLLDYFNTVRATDTGDSCDEYLSDIDDLEDFLEELPPSEDEKEKPIKETEDRRETTTKETTIKLPDVKDIIMNEKDTTTKRSDGMQADQNLQGVPQTVGNKVRGIDEYSEDGIEDDDDINGDEEDYGDSDEDQEDVEEKWQNVPSFNEYVNGFELAFLEALREQMTDPSGKSNSES
eukprot:Trichotokara_eunicae@DN3524_c0_g1_i2.p1